MASLRNRLRKVFNVFSRDPTSIDYPQPGPTMYYRPDRPRLSGGNEKSIVNAVYNRMALDVAAVEFRHVKLDGEGRTVEIVHSCLHDCLNTEANIDQTGRAFIQDAVLELLDHGSVVLVPVETTDDFFITDRYDVVQMRTGQVVAWYPDHVKVDSYDQRTGRHAEVIVPKTDVCIIENPFYSVMNAPNSTMQRLIRKLNLLDVIDEQSGSGKLDLVIQLPYSVKSPTRKEQADERRADIEKQLTGSKYGIAYIDATEHITQLNRPVENNLMTQIQYLVDLLFSQLGITQDILNGTANADAMTNYNNRVIEPIVSAICDELERKLLSKTARTQGHAIRYFKDPFKIVPVTQLPDIADKFTRNEILTSNEVRGIIGYMPSSDPEADELRNKNLNKSKEELAEEETVNNKQPVDKPKNESEEEIQNE